MNYRRNNKGIYYNDEYNKLYLEEDDELVNFVFENEKGRIFYPFIKRMIPYDKEYYDITSPYGYSGPRIEFCAENCKSELLNEFNNEFAKYCISNRIVSEFIRFDPVNNNADLFSEIYEIEFNRKTIHISLESEEIIWRNMKTGSRKKIKNAIENEMKVIQNTNKEGLEKFVELYYTTMKKNNANDLYFFDKKYFEELISQKYYNAEIFSVLYKDRVVSSMIVLIDEDAIHYHLGATEIDAYILSPNNLLFYEVSKWGCKNQKSKFHLGGGYSSSDDTLFRFKKSLNKNGELDFYIGKRILDNEKYIEFTHLNDTINFEEDSFFPLYRK